MLDLTLLSRPHGIVGTFGGPALPFAKEAPVQWRSSLGTAVLPSSLPRLTSIFPLTFPLALLFASLKCVQFGIPPHIGLLPMLLQLLLHWDVGGFAPLLCIGLISSQADSGPSSLYVSL